MKTAYVVKGHVSDEGTIMPVEEQAPAASAYTDEEHDELLREIAAIAALPEASPPDDGFTAPPRTTK